ncbi:MAG: hypothetical protein QW791_08385 [Candidatus Bathyarchaeia archaeon]
MKENSENEDCEYYTNECESKIVTEKELISYLNSGWDIIKELKNGKIVIRRKISNKTI